MPQKKNPDVPELIRGKTGRVYGNLMALLTTMKGLPLTYNKDMQEDKEAVFDTCDTISQCLRLSELIIKDLRFNKERLEEAIQKGNLTATDLVEYLVLKGLSFRQAHELVGRMVSYASQEGKELSQLEIEELKAFCPHIEADVYNWLDPKESVNRKSSFGSTSLKSVLQQIRYAKEELEKC
jgi:argininosuccinate lyase